MQIVMMTGRGGGAGGGYDDGDGGAGGSGNDREDDGSSSDGEDSHEIVVYSRQCRGGFVVSGSTCGSGSGRCIKKSRGGRERRWCR